MRLTGFAQRFGLEHQPVENCYQPMKNADDEFNARKAPLLAAISERVFRYKAHVVNSQK